MRAQRNSNVDGFRTRVSRGAFLIALSASPIAAHAEGYHPDFNCAPAPAKNGVAAMLCQNSDAAKHELVFDQAYYALREVVGPSGWKTLRKQIILDQNAMNQSCSLPIPGADDQTVPPSGPTCYIAGIDKLTVGLKQRLSGPALQEADRDIDTHIAIQKKLADLGFLPPATAADGVYGETTRVAIQTWQRVNHRPSQDGLVSDADAAVLTNSSAPPLVDSSTTAAAPNNSAPPAVAPEPTPPAAPAQTCADSWAACSDNADLINNYHKIYEAQAACKIQADDQAKYGTPVWPGFFSGGPFGSFMRGDEGPRTGIITLVEPQAQFQNGFGAMEHVRVVCRYDLKAGAVISDEIIGQ